MHRGMKSAGCSPYREDEIFRIPKRFDCKVICQCGLNIYEEKIYEEEKEL